MAEPMSIIAGISAVSNIADASCTLAGSLYKTFRAIKDAPCAVQRLSNELEEIHLLLQHVDNLVQRYSTSLLASEDGLSIDSVRSMLQKCRTELELVKKIAETSKRQASKLKNAAVRVKWVFDERKVEQHRQTIEQLRQHINTELVVLGHQYDIRARERDKSLHSQVKEVRSVLDTSPTVTRDLVSSGFSTVRSDIEQVAVKTAHSQEGLQANIQTSHDYLYQAVSQAGVQTSRGIESIQNDVRDVNLLVRTDQQQTMQEFLQINQSIKNVDSMLSQVLSLYSGREESLPNCKLAQHSRLEGLMLSLLTMKSSLLSALSEVKSKSSLEITQEETEFLLNEFENLVAFSHEASALRIRQRSIKAEGEDWPSRGCINHTSMARNYALDVDSFSHPTVTRRERLRTLTHANASGTLKLSFENRAGDVNGWPASILNAIFSYVPNLNVNETGLHATFRKEMRMGMNPSIERSLRVIRIFHEDDYTYEQLIKVFRDDDLHGLQRMLSYGQIRPWDQDWDGWNLLSMALYWRLQFSGKIVDYLLVNAWDIENCCDLQSLFLDNTNVHGCWDPRTPDLFSRVSGRISALGHDIQAESIHSFAKNSTFWFDEILDLKVFDCGDLFKFLINQGADIECRYSGSMETALLTAAEVDSLTSPRMMQELLWLDADHSAVDYKGRGPLHLTLKPSRTWAGPEQHLIFYWATKEKLVHLLQAGCSVHAVDNYGRTPTDVAQRWKRTKAWEAALHEVGKLECARSKCQCEIVKNNISQPCNAALLATDHKHEENKDEDSDVERLNVIDLWKIDTEDVESHPEDSEESKLNGDESEELWIPSDEDEDGHQELELYEADCEDQVTDIDNDEEDLQKPNPSADQDEAFNSKPDKECSLETPLSEDNLDSNTVTSPQVPESNLSPTPEPYQETIALGQHHLWMI